MHTCAQVLHANDQLRIQMRKGLIFKVGPAPIKHAARDGQLPAACSRQRHRFQPTRACVHACHRATRSSQSTSCPRSSLRPARTSTSCSARHRGQTACCTGSTCMTAATAPCSRSTTREAQGRDWGQRCCPCVIGCNVGVCLAAEAPAHSSFVAAHAAGACRRCGARTTSLSWQATSCSSQLQQRASLWPAATAALAHAGAASAS